MLIAITGHKGNGKDTVGQILAEEYGFKKESFAKPIKDAIQAMTGLSDEQVNHPQWKESPIPGLYNLTPRHLMQSLGTAWGRDLIHKNLWADLCIQRIVSHHPRQFVTEEYIPNWYISDLRFENEHQIVRDVGGYVWRVRRNSVARNEFSSHESETEMDNLDSDFDLDNSRDMDYLRSGVRVGYLMLVVKEIKAGKATGDHLHFALNKCDKILRSDLISIIGSSSERSPALDDALFSYQTQVI